MKKEMCVIFDEDNKILFGARAFNYERSITACTGEAYIRFLKSNHSVREFQFRAEKVIIDIDTDFKPVLDICDTFYVIVTINEQDKADVHVEHKKVM